MTSQLKGIGEQYLYEDYVKLLDGYHDKSLKYQPSKTDHEDPLYRMKFPHCMPPEASYMLIPPNKDKGGNTQEQPNARKFYSGWSNLTDFEIQKIAEAREICEDQLKIVIPEDFTDRDILKFCQDQ